VLKVSFFGVRGSCPSPGEANRRYGGNTSCVVLEDGEEPPIILDLGTGLRAYGEARPAGAEFRANVLLSHLHWDHVQGLPFFGPIDRPGARLDVWGPPQEGVPLRVAFAGLVRPPYFPVTLEELRGEVAFHDVVDGELAIGPAKVKALPVPHLGPTLGFRVDTGEAVVAYVSDHQQPLQGASVDDRVVELCEGADLLIHDAQYSTAEFAEKAHWGHSSVDYAVEVALAAGVGTLVLFHHDPSHSDAVVDSLVDEAAGLGAARGLASVVAASEGTVLELPGPPAP
jgi:ribonuclease BN (tRNA processing enzyme)